MTAADLSLIVTNSRIRTGDPAKPWVTALGIRDGKLAVVGMAAEILKMARADTEIIDAAAQLIALPLGTVVGSGVTVTVALDGRITLILNQPQ